MTKEAAAKTADSSIPRMAMTVPEVAASLQIAPASVYRLVERGLLKPSRALRTLRFSRAEVERFLAETM